MKKVSFAAKNRGKINTKSRVLIGMTILLALLVFLGIHQAHISPQVTSAESTDTDTDENTGDQRAYTAAITLALATPKVKYQVSSSTPQFVIFSFDGSKSIDMLNETLAFEHKMQAENKPLHFTYFINAAYFLTKDNAQLYQAPGQNRGVSNIGFASTTQDIALRVKTFNTAFVEGNEIGSHSAGHFNGATWTYDQWRKEFMSFDVLMSGVQGNNHPQPIDTPTFLTSIHGFRAPNLGVNDNLYKVLRDFHFTYDTSGVAAPGAWPYKDAYGIWHIPLGTMFIGQNRTPILAMDYNLWMHQSSAETSQGTPAWSNNFNEVETAYMSYFNTNYNGSRAPIIIGNHFSKWNGGVYWEAMKTFAENVCGQPQVRCVTFKELVDYLNVNNVPPIIQ